MVIFHSFESWEVQEQDADRFGVWGGPASWCIDDCLFTLSSHGGKAEFWSLQPLFRALMPFMKTSPS